jgi:predicted ATPase
LAYLACCLWCLGYPDQALRHSEEALTLARELNHAFTLVDVLCYGGCVLSAMRRDARALRDHAEEMVRVSEKIPSWSAPAIRHCGVAAAMSGQVEEGITQMSAGMAVERSGGKWCDAPRVLGALAEAQAKAGRLEEGLATLTEALSLVEVTDERYWEAELHRLRAEVLLMQGTEQEAEASLHKAVDVARHQMAKSWELRATTSLARLWRLQGRIGDAGQMLAAIYGWFTEGFDTPDLKEARTLLEELS